MSTILFLLFLGTLLGGICLGIFKALGKKGYDTTFDFGKFLKFALPLFALSLLPLTLFSGYSPVEQRGRRRSYPTLPYRTQRERSTGDSHDIENYSHHW